MSEEAQADGEDDHQLPDALGGAEHREVEPTSKATRSRIHPPHVSAPIHMWPPIAPAACGREEVHEQQGPVAVATSFCAITNDAHSPTAISMSAPGEY
jgi:hypothetical protein